MDATLGLQWLSIILMFLFGSIWSEDNVRFGYISTALMAAFFWWIGWIQFAYLATVIPIMLAIAVISFMRSHLKHKYGVMGSQSGLLWKILMFIVMLQFAILLVNGMTIFNTQYTENPTNEFTSYSLIDAESVIGSSTGIPSVDIILAALAIGWMLLTFAFSMILSFIYLYPNMVNVFGVPPSIAAMVSAAVYVLIVLELFMIIFKPFRQVEP